MNVRLGATVGLAAASVISATGCGESASDAAPPAEATEPGATDAREEAAPAQQPPGAPVVEEEARLGFFEPLERTIHERVLPAVSEIPAERQTELSRLAAFLGERLDAGEPARVTFICTHNSRRSHMAQLWAATAAAYYGLDGVQTFSGGTEATAFNPRAVAALGRAGFAFDDPGGDNPHYRVRMGPTAEPMECFSKVFGHETNPQEGFAAVMTCAQADRSCPFVPGADLRVGLPYVDPKEADGTPEEARTYDERSLQIASEMFYLMSRVRE
ncbi:MAG TPA: hypothetical protein RMH99_09455 [Sandaracinaceae bacterium LLY-WYZ-13_1]|nr:hypothetical protein [Sandaracinaceae bacterium LLY-WYZ-13_1]